MATGKTYKSFQYRNNLVWDTARRGRTSAPDKPDIEIGSILLNSRERPASGLLKKCWSPR